MSRGRGNFTQDEMYEGGIHIIKTIGSFVCSLISTF